MLVDAGLIVSMVIILAGAQTIPLDPRAVLLVSGLFAVALAGFVELAHGVACRRLSTALTRWVDALGEWTMEDVLPALRVGGAAYSHRLLYSTRPWFVDRVQSGEAADDDHGIVLRAGMDPELPASLTSNPDQEGS